MRLEQALPLLEPYLARHAAPVEHFMRTKGFQEWWRLRRGWFGDEFQGFVDARMPEGGGALVDDFKRGSASPAGLPALSTSTEADPRAE